MLENRRSVRCMEQSADGTEPVKALESKAAKERAVIVLMTAGIVPRSLFEFNLRLVSLDANAIVVGMVPVTEFMLTSNAVNADSNPRVEGNDPMSDLPVKDIPITTPDEHVTPVQPHRLVLGWPIFVQFHPVTPCFAGVKEAARLHIATSTREKTF